jgi:hypothetical protein
MQISTGLQSSAEAHGPAVELSSASSDEVGSWFEVDGGDPVVPLSPSLSLDWLEPTVAEEEEPDGPVSSDSPPVAGGGTFGE